MSEFHTNQMRELMKNSPQAAEQETSTPELMASENAELMKLHNTVGNQAVQRMLSGENAAKPSLFIQTKMTVGAANDKYEAEADNVAANVMRMSDDALQREEDDGLQAKRDDIQRQEEEEEMQARRDDIQRQEEEEEMQARRDDIQRQEEEEEMQARRDDIQRQDEEELAMKRDDIQRLDDDEPPALDRGPAAPDAEIADDDAAAEGTAGPAPGAEGPAAEDDEVAAKRDDVIRRRGLEGSFDVGGNLEEQIRSQKGSGQSLPDDTRNFFEDRMGHDFSGVKIHSDSQSDNLNRSINAKAFTTGSDVFVRQSDYNPASGAGRELLAHELTHVVQQGGAGVKREKDDKQR